MSLTIALWYWNNGQPPKWGGFRPEHVNRAAAMIRANLKMQHEIACITDSPIGIDSSIRVIPLWDDLATRGRCWRRLKAFAPEMRDIIGPRFAWMDLDMVVTGPLDPIFDRKEDAVFWRSQTTRCPINGSMVMMTAGARAEVWADYDPSGYWTPRFPGTDQSWIAYRLGLHKPNSEAFWTQQDGVLAYNKFCRRSHMPPQFSRLVFFPGTVKPNSDLVRENTPWVQELLNGYGYIDEPTYRWTPRASSKFQKKLARLRERGKKGRRGVIMRSWAV